jgi:phosphoglycolate phosphatase
MKGVPGSVFDGKVEQVLADFGAEFGAEIAANMPADVSGILLPGAAALLEALSRTDNVITLYTGDAPGVVDAVLVATGLGRFFAYRFSGTQFAKREDMVRQAIASAGAGSRREFTGKDVVIIGDAIRDVQCGLAFHALTIGVATGYYSAEQLKQAGADVVVQSLQDTRGIMAAICGLRSGDERQETADSSRYLKTD